MKAGWLIISLVAVLGIDGGAQAEDWTTSEGKVYPQVRIIKTEPDAVTILYRDGGALIPLMKLMPDLQKRFKYDPEKALAALEERGKIDVESRKVLQAERVLMRGQRAALAEASTVVEDNSSTRTSSLSTNHYSMADLFHPSQRLWDQEPSENHHSMSSLASTGPISVSFDEARHHSMDELVGSASP